MTTTTHRWGGRWALALMLLSVGGTVPRAGAQPPESRVMRNVTEDTISLDLKGVDIIDVLKLLSQQSGLNFVAGRNVSGRVTIFARDVDVWEAFERIVEANDLAYERQGNLITVMTARDYELLYGEPFQERKEHVVIPLKFAKAAQLGTVLNQLKSTVGQVVVDETSNTLVLHDVVPRLEHMQRVVAQLDQPTETRVYSLNYAAAEKLKEKLQEFLTPALGTLSLDARTNKVIVTDVPPVIRKIDQVIRAFDERDREVLIEAKLVKVELTDEQSLGIDWQQVFAGIDTKGRSNFRVLSDVVDGAATGAALKFASMPTGNAQVIVEALKKIGKVETISNPRITVANNEEAKILVGTKEAFVTVTTTVPATGSVVTSPEIQFVDVGTKLFVTPAITRDGHVLMKIKPEVSTVKVETFEKNRIPIVSTTEAETSVLVKSGTTLIIGGLMDDKTERNRSQLPVLGDLPVIGAAFRSTVDSKRKTELVVFLTPQIITASGERVTEFHVSPESPLPPSYQAAVRDRLRATITQVLRAAGLGPGSLVVAFTLGREGQVLGTPEISSPQGEPFIRAARDALDAAAPFPPFPGEAAVDRVRFRMRVESQEVAR